VRLDYGSEGYNGEVRGGYFVKGCGAVAEFGEASLEEAAAVVGWGVGDGVGTRLMIGEERGNFCW
jgi:hypothetical protein